MPARMIESSAAAGKLLLVLCSLLALVLSGCTRPKEEPGLFSRRETSSAPPPASETARAPVAPTNPRLPVAGRTTWTTADDLRVQVELAVHAIRRIPGGTVLDWSVTPIRAPGLTPGERIPGPVNLGLSRASQGEVNVLLLEQGQAKVYRPLSHQRSSDQHCLCSPLWLAQLNLRVGETRLLQVTYPALPARVSFVDVDLVTVPPFVHVPVTPLGHVPTARTATDLTRPPRQLPPVAAARQFPFPSGQTGQASIAIERVVASSGQTAVAWTITAVTQQTSFGLTPPGPPLSAEAPPGVLVVTLNTASGPRIQVSRGRGQVLGARYMTSNFQDLGFLECLCTEFGPWVQALRDRGGRVSVTTIYPKLPDGTTEIDVLLPGVGRVSGLPVTRAADSAASTGSPVADRGQRPWIYDSDFPPLGWQTDDWPTPLPDTRQLREYVATVDDMVPVSG